MRRKVIETSSSRSMKMSGVQDGCVVRPRQRHGLPGGGGDQRPC